MMSSTTYGDNKQGFQAHIINGAVHNEFHAPPERPETPPRPSVLIPFSRDKDFVEREIFAEVVQRCGQPGSRTALVGLGGVGKSQLAIAYAYRAQLQSPETWVFWVHASKASRLAESYRGIANYLKLPGRRDPKANVLQLVHDWLQDTRNTWVLILDNLDDAGFLFEHRGSQNISAASESENTQPLVSYIPQCQNGSVLVTTRVKNAALKLVEEQDILLLGPMSEPDAYKLLDKKAGKHGDRDSVTKLADALEYMPLAIVQAAAYISQKAPRCSVQQYLEQFLESDRKKARLLDFEGGQRRRDREASNSIIITWQISFDHIQQIRPSAADLLSLMSFFDRQGIPDSLLRGHRGQHSRDNGEGAGNNMDDYSSGDEDEAFEEDISTLRSYSFISVATDGTSFEMHRLVQLATLRWLEIQRKQEQWKQQFIRCLYRDYPNGEYENWPACQVLLPHAQSAVASKPDDRDTLLQWATILYNAAWYCLRLGNGVEAEELAVGAQRARTQVLGAEHEDTWWSASLVGDALTVQGRWKAAEEVHMQAMETYKKKLGNENPNILASLNSLAVTYMNQGRWEVAEELLVQVIETHKKNPVGDHHDTLISMSNLASTHMHQGRYKAAEELEKRVIETQKKKLGDSHPNTLTSMNNLALAYWKQRRWEAAEGLLIRVIETCRKELGDGHSNTISSLISLASIYWVQGRWEAGEERLMQLREACQKNLGVDNPGTLISIGNLACIYKRQGRHTAAIELMRDCVQRQLRIFGGSHPYFLSSSELLSEWEAELAS